MLPATKPQHLAEIASVIILLLAVPCAHAESARTHAMQFYVYPKGLMQAEKGETAVESAIDDILQKTGSASPWGTVGIALVHPYTAFVEGSSPADFRMKEAIKPFYETIVRVAARRKVPLLVTFNGANWAGPGGPFNAYWKTAEGGRYLARYRDGKVNASLGQFDQDLPADRLKPFLAISPYDAERAADGLFLTNSPEAALLQESRLAVLKSAATFWQSISRTYPGVFRTLSVDSEVCDFSFRLDSSGKYVPIGYEDFVTAPYAERYGIEDRRGYFREHRFVYDSPEDRRWFAFRAELHRRFVQRSVNVLYEAFPHTEIYTHQLVTADEQYLSYKGHDFASPQSTAFVENANPGITFFLHEGRDEEFRKIVGQLAAKAASAEKPFGLMEFHPGKTWTGTRSQLCDYTVKILSYLHAEGASVVALLAWESNSLDRGIRDSGVDDGVKLYLSRGPLPADAPTTNQPTDREPKGLPLTPSR
jgi:hypothetical protein